MKPEVLMSSFSNKYFKNKVIVITGAGTGIGRALSSALQRKGHILELLSEMKNVYNIVVLIIKRI